MGAIRDPNVVYVLRLYVAGGSPLSVRAIRNVARLCEEHLDGRVDLAVVDIYQQPSFALDAQLVAAPTLVKEVPPPRQRFIGTMTDTRAIASKIEVSPEEPGEDGPT